MAGPMVPNRIYLMKTGIVTDDHPHARVVHQHIQAAEMVCGGTHRGGEPRGRLKARSARAP
jgi:hypothetical protein